MAAYPPRKANDEPRNAGTLPPVMRWKSSVPAPAIRSVVPMSRPVISGTVTVAPNMANMCWRPSTAARGAESALAELACDSFMRWESMVGVWEGKGSVRWDAARRRLTGIFP